MISRAPRSLWALIGFFVGLFGTILAFVALPHVVYDAKTAWVMLTVGLVTASLALAAHDGNQ